MAAAAVVVVVAMVEVEVTVVLVVVYANNKRQICSVFELGQRGWFLED